MLGWKRSYNIRPLSLTLLRNAKHKMDVKNCFRRTEDTIFFLSLNIYVTPLKYRAWWICRLHTLFFLFWEALQLTNGPLRAFDIIRDVPHSSLATYVEMGKKSSSRSVLKRPHESQWMVALSSRPGKKEVEGKKIVMLFLPRRAKSRSFATRRRGMPECVPSYFVGGKYSFQNDYRLSFSLFFPPATRMTERWVPPLSVTVRNYKGESAFKDWERRRS